MTLLRPRLLASFGFFAALSIGLPSRALSQPAAASPRPRPATARGVASTSVSSEHLREACRLGGADACDQLVEYWGAREIASGPRVRRARDDVAALREACDTRAVSSACAIVALMLRYGTGTPRDVDASGRYFSRVRELGDLFGFRGQPASPAADAARARQQSECAAGRPRACAVAGWAAFSGVTQTADAQAAYAAWTRGCELGNGTSCRWAGHMGYTHPEVGGTDHAERLLRRACSVLGNPGGCDELGLFLAASPTTRRAAAATFERACNEGSRSGCLHAGQQYESVPGSVARTAATMRFARACAAQETDACTALSRLATSAGGCRFDRREPLASYRARCAASASDGACAVTAACAPSVRLQSVAIPER